MLVELPAHRIARHLSPFIRHDRVSGNLNPPGTAATDWLNQHAKMGLPLSLLVDRADLNVPYVLSSVEDHTPIRHWSLK